MGGDTGRWLAEARLVVDALVRVSVSARGNRRLKVNDAHLWRLGTSGGAEHYDSDSVPNCCSYTYSDPFYFWCTCS